MKSAIPTIDINKLFEDKTILKEVRYENSDVIGWMKKKDIDHEGVMVITGSIEVCSSERFIEGIKHNDDVSNNCGANSHGGIDFDRSIYCFFTVLYFHYFIKPLLIRNNLRFVV